MGFFRLLLIALVGYIVWKIIQIVSRLGLFSHHRHDAVHGEQRPDSKPIQHIGNIVDAEFEEIPPKPKDQG